MKPEPKGPGMAAVRAAAQDLEIECVRQDKEFFTMADLAGKLGLKDYEAKQLVQKRQVYALVKSGELVRVAPGRYRYQGKPAKQPTIQERMWFVLRKRGTVTAEYLAQMADTSPEYALEFLHHLRACSLVKKTGGAEFSLINDPGPELPKNEAKAAYLRQRRAEMKQEIIKRLDAVYGKAVDLMQEAAAARLAVVELGEYGHAT